VSEGGRSRHIKASGSLDGRCAGHDPLVAGAAEGADPRGVGVEAGEEADHQGVGVEAGAVEDPRKREPGFPFFILDGLGSKQQHSPCWEQ